MSTQTEGTGSFEADASISAYRAVKINSDREVEAIGASDLPDGFTQQDAATGDFVAVKFFTGPGTQKCSVTACPVTVGDTVYAATGGQVSTTGTVAVGKSLTTAATNGTIIELVPTTDNA